MGYIDQTLQNEENARKAKILDSLESRFKNEQEARDLAMREVSRVLRERNYYQPSLSEGYLMNAQAEGKIPAPDKDYYDQYIKYPSFSIPTEDVNRYRQDRFNGDWDEIAGRIPAPNSVDDYYFDMPEHEAYELERELANEFNQYDWNEDY